MVPSTAREIASPASKAFGSLLRELSDWAFTAQGEER